MASIGVSGSAEASIYCWASSTLKKGTCYSQVFPFVKPSYRPSYSKFVWVEISCGGRYPCHICHNFKRDLGVNVNA